MAGLTPSNGPDGSCGSNTTRGFGSCHLMEARNLSHFFRKPPRPANHAFHRTGVFSLIPPPNRDALTCTFETFLVFGIECRYRRMAAAMRCGVPTERQCFILRVSSGVRKS